MTRASARGAGTLILAAVALGSWLGPPASAAAGDTLEVRTFTFADIERRRATFDFPDDGRAWERVLMRYTLKCDEATVGDQYPCGEWDVSTQVLAHVHTGRMDSTLQRHPSFVVEGESPAELRYSEEPRLHHFTRWDDPDGSRAGDRYLRFAGTDCITVPPAAVSGIDSTLTVSFWARGDETQPVNDHVIEAGSTGGRVVNVHLPWGTGVVYWDAGGRLGGNNNRLSKGASPGEYKGRWNHWAFTKDARSGEMAVYLNGELWHAAGNMKKGIPPIDSFVIGANLYKSGGWYAGDLDDVRVWDVALDRETIATWRHRVVTRDHPFYAHLVAEYRFDDPAELAAGRVVDSSRHGHDGAAFGEPQLVPFGLVGRGDAKPGPRATLVTESIEAPRMTVTLYEDGDYPKRVTRELRVWPGHDSWYDGDGRWLEDTPMGEVQVLEQREWTWFGDPFEVVEVYEIARFITPYGKGLDLGEDGFTWVYDVTDYAPLLKGTVDLTAGNTLELLDLAFEFVEGTPPREVLGIRNLWPLDDSGYRALADGSALPPVTLRLEPDVAAAAVRSRVSGHGHAGPHNCCEWDAKEHAILVGGLERFRWTVWRDCGMNPVHPQGGTWQFDRAGWCPGTFVDTYDHELTPWLRAGEEIVIDYTVEPYDPSSGEADGRFIECHQLFTYGPPSFRLDAAVADVPAPSARDDHQCMNPVSGEVIVRIRNLGSQLLRSLVIRYGLEGGRESRFEWKGELPFLASEEVTLPAPDWTGLSGGSRFDVRVERPNGPTSIQRTTAWPSGWQRRTCSRPSL